MAKSRGFPLKAALAQKAFETCWASRSDRRKALIREKADEWNYTLKNVLDRWPAYRVEVR